MLRLTRLSTFAFVMATAAVVPTIPDAALAASAAEIDQDAAAALKKLYAREPVAQMLSQKAVFKKRGSHILYIMKTLK